MSSTSLQRIYGLFKLLFGVCCLAVLLSAAEEPEHFAAKCSAGLVNQHELPGVQLPQMNPLTPTTLEASTCIFPVWDTGQLTLHCQYPSTGEVTLVWWLKDDIPICVNSDSLVVNFSLSIHHGVYQCMVQHGSDVSGSAPLELDLRPDTQDECSGIGNAVSCLPRSLSYMANDLRPWEYSPTTCKPDITFENFTSVPSTYSNRLYVMAHDTWGVSWGRKFTVLSHTWNGLEESSLYNIRFQFELHTPNVDAFLYIQLLMNAEEVAIVKLLQQTAEEVNVWVMSNASGHVRLRIEMLVPSELSAEELNITVNKINVCKPVLSEIKVGTQCAGDLMDHVVEKNSSYVMLSGLKPDQNYIITLLDQWKIGRMQDTLGYYPIIEDESLKVSQVITSPVGTVSLHKSTRKAWKKILRSFQLCPGFILQRFSLNSFLNVDDSESIVLLHLEDISISNGEVMFYSDSSDMAFSLKVTGDDSNCKLELRPSGPALSPVTESGHLPIHCMNLSIEVRAKKPAIYDSSVYSWQLDVKYCSDLPWKCVWRDVPLLKESVHVESNMSLQNAINAAANNSTIYVEPGSFLEDIIINKTLKIVSIGAFANTHIFGEVLISAAGVTLQGMTFYPSTQTFSTLRINSSFVTIVNCRFVDSVESLALYTPLPTVAIDCENCPHLKIVNNDFYGWKHAVMLKTTYNAEVTTNIFRFCHCAVSIVTECLCAVRGNLFKNNIIAMEYPITAAADEFLNINTFSGNVIPFFGNEKVVLYPPQNSFRALENVELSNEVYVTGLCSTDTIHQEPNTFCISLKFPSGM
jgi:hypothetical protein